MGWGHVYATLHGEFVGAWQGEIAQCGVRIGFWNPGTGQPLRQMPSYADHRAVFDSKDSTLFNETHTFSAGTLAGPDNVGEGTLRDIATDLHKFANAAKTYQGNIFRWTGVKIALIERGSGKFLYPSARFDFKTPLSGSATAMEPPEVALALSARVGVVGRRGRGRIYLPAIGTSHKEADGTVKSSSRNSLLGIWKTLHDDVANLPGVDTVDTGIIICSANSTSFYTPRDVRIGNHFDVQRRRQWEVPETYAIQNLD